MTNTEIRISYDEVREAMKSTLPVGEVGSVSIRPIVITESDVRMQIFGGGGRGLRQRPGTITGLYRRGGLWMSDSVDEMSDHIPFVLDAHHAGAETILISGLGLGMVVTGLLIVPSVREITVIELDPEVIELVEPHLQKLAAAAGKKLRVIQGDAMDPRKLLPKDAKFDAAWHDIWKDLCTDNLAEMATISRRLARRVKMQGFWGRELLRYHKRQEDRMYRHW